MTDRSVHEYTRSLPTPRRLQVSRIRTALYPLTAAGFAVLGWAMHSEQGRAGAAGWIGLVFGAVTFVFTSVQVARPPVLLLDASGFSEQRLLGKSKTRWDEVGEFVDGRQMHPTVLATLPGARVVWYSAPGDTIGVIRRGYGGLKPTDLAKLLNEYRSAFTSTPGRPPAS